VNRFQRASIVTLVVYLLYSLVVTGLEYGRVNPSERLLFVVTRVALIVSAIPLVAWLRRSARSPWAHSLVGVNFALFTLQGQWFRPFYFFAFFQLVAALSFFFVVPSKVFRWLLPTWWTLFSAVVWWRWDAHLQAMSHPVFSEMLMATSSAAVIAGLHFWFFTHDRAAREEAIERFGRAGMQSARLVHDLKGLTSAPRMYAQLLAERLRGTPDPVVSEALTGLATDLEAFSRIMLELNRLSSMQDRDPTEFSQRDLMQVVTLVVGSRLSGTRVLCVGQARYRTDRGVFVSILLNLTLNALEAFKRGSVVDREIRLESEGQRLVFLDNGGGFDPEVIEAFREQRFGNGASNGSGLGLWFVLDGVRGLGGKVTISNVGKWARVEMELPRRSVLSSQEPPTGLKLLKL
jgi:signal transduction histidine kinase